MIDSLERLSQVNQNNNNKHLEHTYLEASLGKDDCLGLM